MVVGLKHCNVIIKWTNERREMMVSESLQEEPKLILTYPHKSQFNRLAYLAIVVTFLVVRLLNFLKDCGTDFADKMLILIVLIYLPLLIYFMGYYLFINGVKLEIYENDVANYYTYSSRGRSVLHFKFKLEAIEHITIKKRPFHCFKVTLKIRNPIFYGWQEKKLHKLRQVSIIADRKQVAFFMQMMEAYQRK